MMMTSKSEYERPGRAGAALEQRVAAEDVAVGRQQAHAARAVTGRVHHPQPRIRDRQLVAVLQVAVGCFRRIDRVPQHAVGRVQQHRRVDRVTQRAGRIDVVVVAVGQEDGAHATTAHRVDDR